MENIENKLDEEILVEDTTGANAPNIATTDENLSVDAMFQQSSLPSLGRQIFSVVPMHGPTAALFNIQKNGADKFVVLRNEVEVFPSKSINSGLTREVVQDLMSQYGKEGSRIVGNLLKSLTNDQENEKTIEFLEDNCLNVPDLQLTDSLSIETNMFEITQKINELVLKANTKNLRTYEGFCVLPYYAGASVAGLSTYVGGAEGEKDERGLFLAQIGQIKYYMNPEPTSTMAYVGLKDSKNSGKSSAIFSPYMSNVTETVDPDTGNETYFVFNRFAITESPLHQNGNEMLFKFNILQ